MLDSRDGYGDAPQVWWDGGAGTVGMTRIGEALPDFTAQTSRGELHFQSWAVGSWVYVFNLQAGLGPICAEEILDVERQMPRFRLLGIKPLAIVPAPLDAITGWVDRLARETGAPISFPLVADPHAVILKAAGIVPQEGVDCAPSRKSILIDTTARIRASIEYPASVGRNLEEPLRISAAIQTAQVMKMLRPSGRSCDDIPLPLYQPASGGSEVPRAERRIAEKGASRVVSLAGYRAVNA